MSAARGLGDAARGPANERRAGLGWCAASVLLVSLAQLALKWAVQRLPPFSLEAFPATLLQSAPLPLALLFSGLLGYALSMLCWFFALRRLPLSHAYPMLSISYALVCLLAAVLPWFREPLSPFKIAGVLLIMFGVRLIHTAGRGR